MTDADNGQQVGFTNVFVLYASSGIKDDGYTRQYDMTGGTGLYLQGGAWEQINWTKEDATGPFTLTDADGAPLTVAPGKSFIAIWGRLLRSGPDPDRRRRQRADSAGKARSAGKRCLR